MKIKLLALAAVTAVGIVAIKPPATAHHGGAESQESQARHQPAFLESTRPAAGLS